MSVRIMSAVFQANFPPIEIVGSTTIRPANQKLVMLAFADHASDTGESIYPSIETMRQKTGLSNGTLNATIQALKVKGYIVPVKRKSKGNVEYTINLELLNSRIPTPGKQDSNPRKTEIPTVGKESSVNHQESSIAPVHSFSYFVGLFGKLKPDDAETYGNIVEEFGWERVKDVLDWAATKDWKGKSALLRGIRTALKNNAPIAARNKETNEPKPTGYVV